MRLLCVPCLEALKNLLMWLPDERVCQSVRKHLKKFLQDHEGCVRVTVACVHACSGNASLLTVSSLESW